MSNEKNGKEQILIFRTSTDATIQKLIREIWEVGNKEIECLIQSSQIKRYGEEYPDIKFIDINGERFEELPLAVMNRITKKKYDRLYITLSGVKGYHFDNVVKIVSKIRVKYAFFYNCNGEKIRIPKKKRIIDRLIGLYIKLVGLFY